MQIDFIGHASILIQSKGLRILSDPWWEGACFGSQWWTHPRCATGAVKQAPVDYIYISHGHADHLHPGTLRRLPKTAKCLVSTEIDVAPVLREMGFEVIALRPDEVRDLGNGIRAQILPTCNDDTLMVVGDGAETCINLNDALHASPVEVESRIITCLKRDYPKIDYVFCGYGIASHFPNCYRVPGKNPEMSAARRQKHFNRRWVDIIARLEPRFGFPFAANVIFLDEDLFWTNEPVHNAERPTDVFKARHAARMTRVYDIAPGFSITDGQVTAEILFEPVSAAQIRRAYEGEIVAANKVSKPAAEAVEEIADQLRRNVELCKGYLREFPRDYRFLVAIRGADQAIEIAKKNDGIGIEVVPAAAAEGGGHDVVFTTRYAYLRRALSHPYGHEVIFVGSGGIFAYRDRSRVPEGLHRELSVLLRKRESPPPSRFGSQSRLSYMAKTAVKRMLGRTEPDLYDLDAWTVYASSPGAGAGASD